MSVEDTKVTKTDAITELVLENMALKRATTKHEERIAILINRINQLELEKNNSVDLLFFEKQIEKAFINGGIPLPGIILERKKPVSIQFLNNPTCISNGLIITTVTFTSGGYSVGCEFAFKPVVCDDNKAYFYPDFLAATYTKPLMSAKKIKKPAVKKLVPTTLPTVQTSD